MRRITGSTADAVLQALYPKTNDLLKRFEEVKAAANVADGERDRLRKYIQEHVDPGQYDDVLLTKTDTPEQVYVNAEGKHALKNCALVDCRRPEAGIHVVLLRTDEIAADGLASSILKELQKSKEHLVDWLHERTLGAGLTLDNDDLYSEKGGTKIGIVVLPQEVADGTPRAD